MKRALVIVLLAACGAENAGGGGGVDANTASDAAGGCSITLAFTPSSPIADPVAKIRVSAQLGGIGGVPTYDWGVLHSGNVVAYDVVPGDGSQIEFVAPDPGTYSVQVNVGGAVNCPSSTVQTVIVQAPNANLADYRMRTRADAELAPPQQTILQVIGGTNIDRPIALDPGLGCTGTVTAGATGIPAYLRFIPPGNPEAAVETFSALDGTFDVRVLGQTHDVLVVPAVPGIAPSRQSWTPCTSSITLPTGTPVTGTVRDPANAALAGAHVRLTIDGVPSTLATTAADGSFSVLANPVASAIVQVEVTPPAGRGLPLLRASGFVDLAQPLAIRYAATNTTCDLAGTHVQRGGVDQPGAKVTIVGTASPIGTAGPLGASGEIRIVTTANANGQLPALLVPRRTVDAVVEVSSTDVAVATLDLTSCAPTTISAPAVIHRTGMVQDDKLAALTGVQLEAVPVGSLALASALPIQTRTTTGGLFDLPLASGGHYDLHLVDPQARGAQLVLPDIVAAQVPTTAKLPKAVVISGKVSLIGNPNPVIGTSIQMLCVSCTGIDASRPVGEAATDEASMYRIAVPDPGTM